MAQHLKHKAGTDLLASQSNDAVLAEDELDLINTAEAISAQPIDWIKNNFPRGTLAGNFLHEIFEHIDFQCSDDWVIEIRRRFKMTIVAFGKIYSVNITRASQKRKMQKICFTSQLQSG